MAKSKLSQSDRARRKREAARLRQQRCRARKKQETASQARDLDIKTDTKVKDNRSMAKHQTVHRHTTKRSAVKVERSRKPSFSAPSIQRQNLSFSDESSVPDSHSVDSRNATHLPNLRLHPRLHKHHPYPTRQHPFPLIHSAHSAPKCRSNNPSPSTPALARDTHTKSIFSPNSSVAFPHELPLHRKSGNAPHPGFQPIAPRASPGTAVALAPVSEPVNLRDKDSQQSYINITPKPMLNTGDKSNQDVSMNAHELTAVEAMIALRHSPVSVQEHEHQHSFMDSAHNRISETHCHNNHHEHQTICQTPVPIRPKPLVRRPSPHQPICNNFSPPHPTALALTNPVEANSFYPSSPHPQIEVYRIHRANALMKNESLTPGVYFYHHL